MTPRDAARVYGVHHDFFRKRPELRRYRVILSKKLHVYPVEKIEAFFHACGVDD